MIANIQKSAIVIALFATSANAIKMDMAFAMGLGFASGVNVNLRGSLGSIVNTGEKHDGTIDVKQGSKETAAMNAEDEAKIAEGADQIQGVDLDGDFLNEHLADQYDIPVHLIGDVLEEVKRRQESQKVEKDFIANNVKDELSDEAQMAEWIDKIEGVDLDNHFLNENNLAYQYDIPEDRIGDVLEEAKRRQDAIKLIVTYGLPDVRSYSNNETIHVTWRYNQGDKQGLQTDITLTFDDKVWDAVKIRSFKKLQQELVEIVDLKRFKEIKNFNVQEIVQDISKAEERIVLSLYQDGREKSIADIVQELDVSEYRVRKLLDFNGLLTEWRNEVVIIEQRKIAKEIDVLLKSIDDEKLKKEFQKQWAIIKFGQSLSQQKLIKYLPIQKQTQLQFLSRRHYNSMTPVTLRNGVPTEEVTYYWPYERVENVYEPLVSKKNQGYRALLNAAEFDKKGDSPIKFAKSCLKKCNEMPFCNAVIISQPDIPRGDNQKKSLCRFYNGEKSSLVNTEKPTHGYTWSVTLYWKEP